MNDLRDLYQEVILDHNRQPRNFREMGAPTSIAEGHNPNCGDHMRVYVALDGDRIDDLSFQGNGCAISKASASMMTDALKGKSLDEAGKLFDQFHKMVTAVPGEAVVGDDLGKLAVFSGVCEYPSRVKCASLAWHTLKAALAKQADPVTTE